MKIKTFSFVAAALVGLAGAIFLSQNSSLSAQGPLAPTTGPAPSMVTLEQLGLAANSTGGSKGQNIGFLGTSSAIVFNSQTGTFSAEKSIISPKGIIESQGNICVIGGVEAAAWTPTAGWVSLSAISLEDVLLGSNGNFLVRKNNTAYAFNGKTGVWDASLSGGVISKQVGSNGNFAVTTTPNILRAWSPDSGWVNSTLNGGTNTTIVGADSAP